MENDPIKIFKALMQEVDKIEDTLLAVKKKQTQEKEEVASKITDALKCLESILEIMVKNTDLKTMIVNDDVFNFDTDEINKQLERIGLLSRRIAREIVEHNRIKDSH